MYLQEKTDEFFIHKIVFNEQPIHAIKNAKNDQINNEYLDSLLVLIDDFILVHNDMQAFDDFVVNNLFEIINFIKYNYNYSNNNDRQIKYQYYNDLISRLNNALRTNNDAFYRQQFIDRGIFWDFKFHDDNVYLPDELRHEVRISLCYDNFFYDILTKKIDDVSKSEKSKLIMNTLFLYSVNYFYYNCKEILENNELLKQVLLENRKIMRSVRFNLGLNYKYEGVNHRYEKTNCLIKSSKQILKEFRWS